MELIKNIQGLLLKYFNKNSWQQYIDTQKYGKCDFIAFLVSKICSDFSIIEIKYNFSKIAIKQLHQKNDFGDMFGTHYLNEYNNELYDFSKGCNSISNIYLMKNNKFDKYTVTLTNQQKSLITEKNPRILNQDNYLIKQEFIGLLNKELEYLYHATYKPLLSKIRKTGLGNTKKVFWEDSKPGIVYLANDPNVAESYAQTNENCPEQWIDNIIIFQINKNCLDQNKLFVDNNVLLYNNELPVTFQYHGIIPFDMLQIYNKESFEKTYLKNL